MSASGGMRTMTTSSASRDIRPQPNFLFARLIVSAVPAASTADQTKRVS